MKKIIIGLFLTCTLFVSCEEEKKDYDLREGLVAYYPFNGNANDESVNSNHGTLVGAVFVQDRKGKDDSALSFDGDGDYVNCGSSNRGITDTITISLWLKTSDTYSYVLSKYNLLECEAGYVLSINLDGLLRLMGRDIDGSEYDFILISDPPSAINDYNWHHVLAVIVPNQWKLYIDGIVVGTATSTTASPYLTNDIELTIASNPDIGTIEVTELAGIIDDVAIYNRVLSEKEMEILRKKGI